MTLDNGDVVTLESDPEDEGDISPRPIHSFLNVAAMLLEKTIVFPYRYEGDVAPRRCHVCDAGLD